MTSFLYSQSLSREFEGSLSVCLTLFVSLFAFPLSELETNDEAVSGLHRMCIVVCRMYRKIWPPSQKSAVKDLGNLRL